MEINKTLPKEKKIRVISTSVGWSSSDAGYDQMVEVVDQAKKEGLFIVSSSLQRTFGFAFQGLGREPLKAPDDPQSYEPGIWWAHFIYEGKKISEKELLLIPMDSRCVASPTGNEDYGFYRKSGWSWSIPYIAGLYVLACQVKPDVTPDEFWTTALKTGTTTEFEHEGKKYKLGKIVNPEKMILTLQMGKK